MLKGFSKELGNILDKYKFRLGGIKEEFAEEN